MSGVLTLPPDISPRAACAPCGPGCRLALPLPDCPDFVWCERRHEPRYTTNDEVDCRQFDPRPGETHMETLAGWLR
jgi:hypothetical protein